MTTRTEKHRPWGADDLPSAAARGANYRGLTHCGRLVPPAQMDGTCQAVTCTACDELPWNRHDAARRAAIAYFERRAHREAGWQAVWLDRLQRTGGFSPAGVQSQRTPASQTRKKAPAPKKDPEVDRYRWVVYNESRKEVAAGLAPSRNDARADALDKAQALASGSSIHPRFILPTWRYSVYGPRGSAVIYDKPCSYSRVGR